MAILDNMPSEEDVQRMKGTLNYYVDKWGRVIVRKWRRKSGKYNKGTR